MGVLVPTGDRLAVRRTAQFFLNSFQVGGRACCSTLCAILLTVLLHAADFTVLLHVADNLHTQSWGSGARASFADTDQLF
jgi:hypothetical protein